MRVVCVAVLIVSLSLAQAHAASDAVGADIWLDLPVQHRTWTEALKRVVTIVQQLGAVQTFSMDLPWHTDFFDFPDHVHVSAMHPATDDAHIALHCTSVLDVHHQPSQADAERHCAAIRDTYLGPDS